MDKLIASEDAVYIAPSILSADILHLKDEVQSIIDGGADLVHIDVMDGHFVPNLTFGPSVIKAIKTMPNALADVHLMITNAEQHLDAYINAGTDILTVHAEAITHLDRCLSYIRSKQVMAGVSLNPATPVSVLKHVLPLCDLVLIMSVNPGFGGQSYIAYAEDKIKEVKALAQELSCNPLIEVDGGISRHNAAAIAQAGAHVLVAGSAIYGAPNRAEEIRAMRLHAREAKLRCA